MKFIEGGHGEPGKSVLKRLVIGKLVKKKPDRSVRRFWELFVFRSQNGMRRGHNPLALLALQARMDLLRQAFHTALHPASISSTSNPRTAAR